MKDKFLLSFSNFGIHHTGSLDASSSRQRDHGVTSSSDVYAEGWTRGLLRVVNGGKSEAMEEFYSWAEDQPRTRDQTPTYIAE